MADKFKFEVGHSEKFTLVTSLALDEAPLFFVKDEDDTLIYSSTGAQSDTSHYYEFYTMPNSIGDYSYHWYYSISTNTYHTGQLFEIVKTAAITTSGYYCNAMDIINQYEPLREDGYTYHEIDQDIIDAQAQVNNILGIRYPVPFEVGANSLPPIIPVLTKNLVVAAILEPKTGGMPEWAEKRRDRALDMLKAIAVGSEALLLPDGTVMAPTMPSNWAQVEHNLSDYEQTFNMLGWSQMRIDPDRLDDEEDALD
jgi:hypothetical protein